MRFASSAVAGLLALATSAFAQTAGFDPISKPLDNEVVAAGSTYIISWNATMYTSESVSISLIGGATQGTQIPIMDLAAGVVNSAGTFSWTVDSTLGDDAVYGLVIALTSNPKIFQYSFPFHIKATGGETSSAYPTTGSATKTITTSYGVKTVTLKSTTVPCTNTTTTTKPMTTYKAHNSTTSCTTLMPATSAANVTAAYTPTQSSSAPIATQTKGAAPRVGASTLALISGLALAFFAL